MASHKLRRATSLDTLRSTTSELSAMEAGHVFCEGVAFSDRRSQQQRRVKVTLWRFINACLLLGLATAKGILAFRDNSGVDALDMAIGLVWAFIAYCGTIIELENPQVAPWLFEVGPVPFLQGIGIMLLPCTFAFALMGFVELLATKFSIYETPSLSRLLPWIILGSSIVLGAILVAVAFFAGNFTLGIIPRTVKKVKIPLHVFAIDDWRLSTMFKFSSWNGWLFVGIGFMLSIWSSTLLYAAYLSPLTLSRGLSGVPMVLFVIVAFITLEMYFIVGLSRTAWRGLLGERVSRSPT